MKAPVGGFLFAGGDLAIDVVVFRVEELFDEDVAVWPESGPGGSDGRLAAFDLAFLFVAVGAAEDEDAVGGWGRGCL